MARVRQLRLNRWLILLALGTALPLLAVAATTFGWLIHDFRADQDRRQADTARALALAVDGEVRSWKAAVTMLAASTALEQGRLADFDEEARRLAAQHDGWVVLTVASGEQLLNTLRPYGSPHAMTSSPETINAIFATGTPVISDVIYGQVTHGYLVAVGVPVRREGKVVNGLTLNFAPDRLTRLLQSQNVPASWIAAVNDRQHHVVARSSKIEERVGKPLVPWLAAAQEAAEHGIATGPLVDGRPGQVAFQRLQEAPWTVTLTVPVAELETAWQRPVLVYLVLVALAVLGAVGLAVGLARRIERPVREVAAAAARIVHGLTSVPQPQQSHVTEVAELQTALANGATVVQMALRSSQEAAGALREANAMLEARVAERTAELTEANAELTQEVHERQRVEADLRDSGAFTGALNAIAGLIHSTLDVEAIMQRVIAAAADALEADTAAISLWDPHGWRMRYVHNLSLGVVGTQITDADEPHVLLALQTRQPVAVANAFIDPRVNNARMEACGIRSVLVVPLFAAEEPLGVICFNYQHRHVEFELRQVRFAEQLATDVALALTNARLFDQVQAELRERTKAEEARRSVALFPEQNPNPILRIADAGTLLYANAGSAPLLQHWQVRVGEQLAPAQRAVLLAPPTTDPSGEVLVLCGDRIYSLMPVPIPGSGYVNVYGRDVTLRERTLAQLQESLASNKTLLREVHHRVKNNLQLLCDLMFLQMEAMPDRDQHQDLQDAHSRVYAIARLHEQLYQSMDSGRIRLAEYLRRLADGFKDLFPDVRMHVEAAADDISLNLDRAIHLGLLVNELVTHAIKHAFPRGEAGEVTLGLRVVADQIQLEVRDKGRGVPADLDLEQAKTFGLRTVRFLARRLQAEVTVTGNGGTCFTLTFPLHADDPVDPK